VDVLLVNRKMLSESKSLYDKVSQVFRYVRSHIVFLEDGRDFLACDKLGIGDSITVP